MKTRLAGSRGAALVVLAFVLTAAMTAWAQFGHPLKGTWSGDWGMTKANRTHVVLELNWDGRAITGVINPGPNAVPLQKASLDPDTWAVHLEADAKNASGQIVHRVIDGKLENIGAYQRVISGTWMEGTTKGDFRVTRN